MPLTVTFDTNTFDKAVRPAVYASDPADEDFFLIHDALKHGGIQGFLAETIITLEGITNDQRAKVFGNTTTHGSLAQTSDDTFTLTITPVQADRSPLHPKQAERFIEAFHLGIRLLGAPRIGMPRAEEQFYAVETRWGGYGGLEHTPLEGRWKALEHSEADPVGRALEVALEPPFLGRWRALKA
jgi:hypothetical protein